MIRVLFGEGKVVKERSGVNASLVFFREASAVPGTLLRLSNTPPKRPPFHPRFTLVSPSFHPRFTLVLPLDRARGRFWR